MTNKQPRGCAVRMDRARRDLVLTGTAALAGIAIAPNNVAAATKPEAMEAQEGDRIQLIKGPNKDEFLRADMMELNAPPIEAFPFDPAANVLRKTNRLNRMLVIRLDPSEMDQETRDLSADGLLVFSALCTHRACTIKSWMLEERHLRCHCHLSEFDALSGGSVMNGPAKRRLPMVPLGVDGEGFVVAMGGFNGRLGAAKK